MAGRRAWWAGPVVALALVAGPAADAPAAGPDTGPRWSVLACRFADVPATPRPTAYLDRLFGAAGAGTGGLWDWFADQSGGRLHLEVTVRGWFTMAWTRAQEARRTRWQRIADCVTTAARSGYALPEGDRVVVVTNAVQDSGAAGERVLLDPSAWTLRYAAHELGHGYGLAHSWSNDVGYRNGRSGPGEYDDPWDEMSALHVHSAPGRWGRTAVDLDEVHRAMLGWVPGGRVTTLDADRAGSAVVRLAPSDDPSLPGSLLLRVVPDPARPDHYYAVELRRRRGWSAAEPADTVLLHEVRGSRSTLLRDLSAPGHPPARSVSVDGLTISVDRLAGDHARIRVTVSRRHRAVADAPAAPAGGACIRPATPPSSRTSSAPGRRHDPGGFACVHSRGLRCGARLLPRLSRSPPPDRPRPSRRAPRTAGPSSPAGSTT